MRAAYEGHHHFANETEPILREYISRKRLAKLGFMTDISKLDTLTGKAFCIIDQLIDELDRKRAAKGK